MCCFSCVTSVDKELLYITLLYAEKTVLLFNYKNYTIVHLQLQLTWIKCVLHKQLGSSRFFLLVTVWWHVKSDQVNFTELQITICLKGFNNLYSIRHLVSSDRRIE